MDEPIMTQPLPRPADKSAVRPIYIVVIEQPDSKNKGGVESIYSKKVDKFETHIDIRGNRLTKVQAEEVRKNPNANVAEESDFHIMVPWQRVIRIENVTFKAKGKTNE